MAALAGWIAASAPCLGLFQAGRRAAAPDRDTAVVFRRGHAEPVRQGVGELASEVERFASAADDSLLLIMTPERIAAVKRSETCLEFVFAPPRQIAILGRKLWIGRILVPFTGRFGDGVFFFAAGNDAASAAAAGYGATDFARDARGLDRLKDFLKARNVRVQ